MQSQFSGFYWSSSRSFLNPVLAFWSSTPPGQFKKNFPLCLAPGHIIWVTLFPYISEFCVSVPPFLGIVWA